MKILKITFLLQLLIAFCYTPVQSQNQNQADEIRRLNVRFKTAYDMGEYRDALEECKKIQQLVPNFPNIYKTMAEVYEKLGSEEDLNHAIKNYRKYLELAPKADDKKEITDHISKLEYVWEKKHETNRILDDLKGIWISDVKMPKNNSLQVQSLWKSYGGMSEISQDSVPVMVFKIIEVGNEGKFRIEMQPESGFYKESIIRKVVNIVPEKGNLRFTFADSEIYNPSEAGYAFLKIVMGAAMSATGLPSEVGQIGNVVIDAAQENDIPKETKTLYDFQLTYENGKLKGYCNVLQHQKDAKTDRYTKDDFFEITLEKDDNHFKSINEPRNQFKLKNEYGYYMTEKEVANSHNPHIITMRSAYKMGKIGKNTVLYGGIPLSVLGGTMYGLSFAAGEYGITSRTASEYILVSGLLASSLGATIWISEHQKFKKAQSRYNESLNDAAKTSFSPNTMKIGITPLGMFGFTYTF